MRLLQPLVITTALAGTAGPTRKVHRPDQFLSMTIQAKFTWGSGGTTVDAYVQTSLDEGTTWIDVANFHFLLASATKVLTLSSLTPVASFAPTNGSIASDTVKDGVFGNKWRVLVKSTGTYAGNTTLEVDVNAVEMT